MTHIGGKGASAKSDDIHACKEGLPLERGSDLQWSMGNIECCSYGLVWTNGQWKWECDVDLRWHKQQAATVWQIWQGIIWSMMTSSPAWLWAHQLTRMTLQFTEWNKTRVGRWKSNRQHRQRQKHTPRIKTKKWMFCAFFVHRTFNRWVNFHLQRIQRPLVDAMDLCFSFRSRLTWCRRVSWNGLSSYP